MKYLETKGENAEQGFQVCNYSLSGTPVAKESATGE
jgi:hypothetical protein